MFYYVIGFSKEYAEGTTERGKWLQQVFGLSFFGEDDVREAFVEDLMSCIPANMEKFCDYLLNTYIAEEATFPPCIWAEDEVPVNKTTNICESFHSKWNAEFTAPHPNIYVFGKILQPTQEETYIKMRSVNDKQPSNTDSELKYAKIQVHLLQYKSKIITRMEFVKRISKYYKHYVTVWSKCA